jgi:hypothetical protein
MRQGSLAILFISVFARVSAAEQPKLSALTRAYAEKHGLKVRVVKSDLGTRQIEREFVPVLPTTHESFLDHFKLGNSAIVWRTFHDPAHPILVIEPGKHFEYNFALADGGKKYRYGWSKDGFYLSLAVNAAEVANWEGFIRQYVPEKWSLYQGQHNFRMPGTNECYGGCMWYLVHGELAPRLNLATAMGVRRAKGAEVLAPRLIHAGNERVGPIGVPVNSIEQFNAMTDDQLLGPEPAGGAAEQVHVSE